MTYRGEPTINREIDDIKAHIQRELDTVRDLMDTNQYRNSPTGWAMPYHLHRLRRALRIHYLALKIRESTPVPDSIRELSWDLDPNAEFY
ncbi:hypothetical protein EU537_10460 [Candidatus Thorarchaeota archaeon]|nr:MAG: hypothetical protein EU537_10460 [Candidatus Thorarchaeota archaeon]